MRLAGGAVAGKQVSILGKATKQARKLIITGAVTRFYGYATMGCSPTSQKRMTAVITNAGGYRKAGGCATTALFLHQLLRAHPMVHFPLETVVEFLIAHLNGGVQLVNAAAWEKNLVRLQQGGRRGRVYGTMSAAMASLLDTEFEIPSINSWIDPTGQA